MECWFYFADETKNKYVNTCCQKTRRLSLFVQEEYPKEWGRNRVR